MTETKSPLKSLAVAGGGLAIVGSLAQLALSLIGVTDPADQAFYLDNGKLVVAAGFAVASGVGGLMAIVGRLRATKILKI